MKRQNAEANDVPTVLLCVCPGGNVYKMSSAVLRTDFPSTPRNFMHLDADTLEQIVIKMLPQDAFGARAACTSLYAAATADPVWTVFMESLLGSSNEDAVALDPSMSACQQYFQVAQHQKQRRGVGEAKLFLDYHLKDAEGNYLFGSLRQLGRVADPGGPGACFLPAAPIQTPVPAVVALEMLRLYTTTVAAKGSTPVDKYRKVAELLGVPHTSLRSLDKRFPKDPRTKRAATARALAAPFPEASHSAAGKAPDTPAEPQLRFSDRRHGQTPETESVRFLKRKVDSLSTDNYKLLETNRILRQRLDDAGQQLRLEREASARQLSSRSKEGLRLARRIAELEAQSVERSEVHNQDLRRAHDRLAAERERASKGAQRIVALRRSLQAAKPAINAGLRVRVAEQELQINAAFANVEAERQQAAAARQSLEERLALEKSLNAQLSREVTTVRRTRFEDFKKQYWAEALEQQATNSHSPTKRGIAASVIATAKLGAELRLPQPNATRQGPGMSAIRMAHAKKGHAVLQPRAARMRRNLVTPMLTAVAGGAEHTVALIADHAKANPKLYAKVGLASR